MTKILLAIENSDFSKAAVQEVCGQRRVDEAEVHVLNVIDPLIYLPLYDGVTKDMDRIDALREEYMKQGKDLVAEAEKALRAAGCKVVATVEEGEPRTAIVDYAAKIKADLIVMGSHGRRGLPRIFLGSVSEYVARHAPCSVEIVRPHPRAA
ncbi:MAG TPA: universal stress protein [Candidatus Acidoferrales bacterium]|nr:universal stress protein [Candidatus Acidoferrales bacterium]